MSPKTLVLSALVCGVVMLLLLQWARPEPRPAPPEPERDPVVVAALVAAQPAFVAQVNRLKGGETLDQVRATVSGAPVEDDAQTRGYCFPDLAHCDQRVILRFNAQGQLYQLQSSVPHVPARQFSDFQPAPSEPSKMTAE